MSGYSIANAMHSELVKKGYKAAELIDEDFGWFVIAKRDESELEFTVALSSLADPDGDPNAVVELMVAIEPQKLTKGVLWWKKDISTQVKAHSNIVFGFLRSSPGIEVIEEFSGIK